MKAKRRVCALLFSALMIWQGFMIVNAEGVSAAAANANGAPSQVAEAGTVPGASGSGESVQQDSGTFTQAGETVAFANPSTARQPAASASPAGGETDTPGSSDTVGNDTTQEGNGSGSEPTAPGAPASGGSVQQDSGTSGQAGVERVDDGTTTKSDAPIAAPAAVVSGTVRSQHQPTLVNDVIQHAEIYLDGNDPKKPGDQLINQTTVLQLKADLIIAGKELYGGDYAEIVLPPELKSYSKEFDIKGTGDVVVAKGKYDEGTRTIRITFTDAIETINKANG